tara:strand:- start:132 stop:686 length:555 start_codon:yes stop_codon:yes gene_type:complete
MDFSHIDNIFPNNKVIEFYCGSLINHNSKRILYKSCDMYIKYIKNIRQIQKWYRIQMHTKKSNIAHTFMNNVIKDSIRTISITPPNQADNGNNTPHTYIHDPNNTSDTSLHDPIHTVSISNDIQKIIPQYTIHDPIETLYYNSSNASLQDPIHTISTISNKQTSSSMFSYITGMLYSMKKRVIG